MNRLPRMAAALAAAALAGCATMQDRDPASRQVSSEIERSERMASESRTLSSLAALERSLNDFIKATGRIPLKLEQMVPEYLAEIPETNLGVPKHKDSSAVRVYGGDLIVNGQVDGSRLRDTGGWGYVFNERQVIVFIDCTHKNMRGNLWYQARGVF